MALYKILKDFSGSQRGFTPPVRFKAGQVVELNEHLAEVAVIHGQAELAEDTAEPTATYEPTEVKIVAPTEPTKPPILKLNKKA